jgi:hypothetical protein
MIRYVKHDAIDKAAWDADLDRCANKLWYGRSDVLDAAAPGWEALIDEVTGARLPLPWRRKFGVVYAYQPFLLQQLGPFSPDPRTDDAVRFLEALPARFRYLDMGLSPSDPVGTSDRMRSMSNDDFLLALDPSIDILRSGYSENHRRNLRKASKNPLHLDPALTLAELIAFLRDSHQFKVWRIDPMRVALMEHLFTLALARGEALMKGVRHEGALVAAGFFVRWGGRIIFLKGLASAEGKRVGAMHALLDDVIAAHAGSGLLLDFAGSNDADLARFYAGFGARRSGYLRALVNRLPPVIRRMKP